MALAGVAAANDATLVWDWSFNSTTNLHKVVNAAGTNYTTLSFTWNSADVTGGICTTSTNNIIKVTDSSSSVTMGGGYSFVLQGGAVSNPSDWGILFCFGVDESNNIKVADSDSGTLKLLGEGGCSVENTNATYATPYGEGGTYIVTVGALNEDKKSQLTLYYNGNAVHTATLTPGDYSDDAVDMFSIGGRLYKNSPKPTQMRFTNVQLYDGVLSSTQIAQLSIPEPTTATLSLLALAGLAARRRRR